MIRRMMLVGKMHTNRRCDTTGLNPIQFSRPMFWIGLYFISLYVFQWLVGLLYSRYHDREICFGLKINFYLSKTLALLQMATM
jgi:hypothetical protein